MTRLCSATVEMSNGNCWFCCKLAVLSGSAALVVVPATALCAGTLVPAAVVALLASLATGGAGAAAWFPVDELDDGLGARWCWASGDNGDGASGCGGGYSLHGTACRLCAHGAKLEGLGLGSRHGE